MISKLVCYCLNNFRLADATDAPVRGTSSGSTAASFNGSFTCSYSTICNNAFSTVRADACFFRNWRTAIVMG
jgi:hypothetical protein